eukprot:CAMPEP_0172893312 /NCGR_PEP_ID=MMETSP1075-20121228/148209_1 /TAXON_ID=2916 /ORGANISM="Ceratium fusus, Strain PA161109" /LENGTH=55 /DNA_ID=CAMNT_0013748155 /DNA_START=131 /DNA_END=294 /DNA_ORIENTATION=-
MGIAFGLKLMPNGLFVKLTTFFALSGEMSALNVSVNVSSAVTATSFCGTVSTFET